jgi:hypothetical protein
MGVKIAAYLESHTMAQLQIGAYAGTTEIQIAVLHAEVVAAIGVVLDGKRRNLAAIQHLERFSYNLDVARRQVRILRRAFGHGAFDLDYELASEFIGPLAESRIRIIVEHHLGYTITVADIDKSHTAHLACTLHPSGQRYRFSGIGESQLSARFVSIHEFLVNIYYVFINHPYQPVRTAGNHKTCKDNIKKARKQILIRFFFAHALRRYARHECMTSM